MGVGSNPLQVKSAGRTEFMKKPKMEYMEITEDILKKFPRVQKWTNDQYVGIRQKLAFILGRNWIYDI